MGTSQENSMTFNILVKEEDNFYVAHCLELDIVATGKTPDDAKREIVALVCAQVDYAFSNDNIENLYHPAPKEVWEEFFKCKEHSEQRYKLERTFNKAKGYFLPSSIIANTCQVNNYCRA